MMVAGHAGTGVTPNPATLTFTTSNWSTAKTVTVTAAADEDTANDTVSLTHSATSNDTHYSGITIAGVTVRVVDNDDTAAGICGRTEEVRDALVDLIPGVSDCAAVTAADLAAITGPARPVQPEHLRPCGGGFRRADRADGVVSGQQRADHAAR